MAVPRRPLAYASERRCREPVVIDAARWLRARGADAHPADGEASDDELLLQQRRRIQLDANPFGRDDVASQVEGVGDRQTAKLDRALSLAHLERGNVHLRPKRLGRCLRCRLPDYAITKEEPEGDQENE